MIFWGLSIWDSKDKDFGLSAANGASTSKFDVRWLVCRDLGGVFKSFVAIFAYVCQKKCKILLTGYF